MVEVMAVMPASRLGGPGLESQLPSHFQVPAEAQQVVAQGHASPTHAGELDAVLHSWLGPGPALAVADIWGSEPVGDSALQVDE